MDEKQNNIIKFFEKINYKYLAGVLCIIVLMYLTISSNQIIQNFSSSKNIDPSVIGLFRSTFTTVLTVICFLGVSKFMDKGFFDFRTQFLGIHVIKSILYVFGLLLWNTALTIDDGSMPLYLSSFTYISTCLFTIILSILLLGDSFKNNAVQILLSSLALTPLIKFIFVDKVYGTQIIYVLIASFLYAGFDILTSFIQSDEKYQKSFMAILVKRKSKEGYFQMAFYTAVLSNIFSIVPVVINFLSMNEVNLEIQKNILLNMSLLDYFVFVKLGIISLLSFICVIIAFTFATASSLQPVRVLEPLLSGGFSENKHIPREINVGIGCFFLSALYTVITESKKNDSAKK